MDENPLNYYWNCRIEQKMEMSIKEHNLIRSNDLYIFLNSFVNPCPLCKYEY
jgi:hypothetical protein